jgi:hypothetical protein
MLSGTVLMALLHVQDVDGLGERVEADEGILVPGPDGPVMRSSTS